jgi:uncharacterized protein (DUF302 family)
MPERMVVGATEEERVVIRVRDRITRAERETEEMADTVKLQ